MSLQETAAPDPKPGLSRLFRRVRLVWKVNGLFLLILASVLGISGYLANLDFQRAEMAHARDLSRVTSERIVQRIEELMLGHEAGTLRPTVNRLATENPAYRDVRLLSHRGQVLASQTGEDPRPVDQESWPCTLCHGPPDRAPSLLPGACCEVIGLPDGERALSVVTPIYREAGCGGTGCHEEIPPSQLLAVLQADFSLASMDALLSRRTRNTALIILLMLMVGTGLTWWMTDRLVGRRIQALRAGAQRIAEHDFSFRFSDSTGDGIAQLVGVFDNVTAELSSTLSELTSTREHLHAIVENSADIIITVDPSGYIKTFNPGAEQILGYSREEVIGKRVEMLFADPRERDAAIAQLQHTDHVMNYLTHFVTREGNVREVILTLSRLRSPDGLPIGTLGISKDVTRELRLQRELLRSERMAALGQAITGIQHTIKNLLNVLKGGSYMVKLGLAKEDRDLLMEGWEMVQQGIEDMTQMSTSMLEFVRTRRLRLKPTELEGLAKKVQELSQASFREAGVTLELDVAGELPPVRCDAEMIRSIMVDLLSNAQDACTRKAYGPGETPTVTLEVIPAELPGFVQISVKDNGEGMTDEIRQRVFTPFFTTKKKKGTGVGLAVVARIVNTHQGKVQVRSEPGAGATFQILLPISGPSLNEEEEDA